MSSYGQTRQQLAVCIKPSGNSVKHVYHEHDCHAQVIGGVSWQYKVLLLLLPADTGFETTPLWGLAFALTLTGNVTALFRAFCQLSFTPAIMQP